MEIFIAMGVFFIVVTAIFVAVAVFLPEWIGITGSRAKEIMREQQGDWVDTEATSLKSPADTRAADAASAANLTKEPKQD